MTKPKPKTKKEWGEAKTLSLYEGLAKRDATISGLRADILKAAYRERVLRRRAEALAPTIERLEKVAASLSALREPTVHVEVPGLATNPGLPGPPPWWAHFVSVALAEARAGAKPVTLGAALDHLAAAVDQLQGRLLSMPVPKSGQLAQGRAYRPGAARDLVNLAGLALFYVELIQRGDL